MPLNSQKMTFCHPKNQHFVTESENSFKNTICHPLKMVQLYAPGCVIFSTACVFHRTANCVFLAKKSESDFVLYAMRHTLFLHS